MPFREGDEGMILFERPRVLGPGVEVFNAKDQPMTPTIEMIQPDDYPSKLTIDGAISTEYSPSGSVPLTMSPLASCGFSSTGLQSGSQSPINDDSLPIYARQSFSCDRGPQYHLRRVLLLGSPGLLTTHVTSKLLTTGHHMRLLDRDYRGKSSMMGLSSLVKTRPSRLSIFYDEDLSLAVTGCDAVVYLDGPDTSDTCEEDTIVRRYESSVQDLFLSIRSHGKSVRRVIFITPASSMFPVETALTRKAQHLQRAHAAALKEAERLSAKAGVPMTVLLPSMVVGKPLMGECDPNVQVLANFAKKRRLFTSPFRFNIVDAADVAEACARALMSPNAEHQKYILSAGELSLSQIASTLEDCVPCLKPPKYELPAFLIKPLLWTNLLEWADFEYCERGSRERVGWTYPLSCLKVHRDLGLQLRSASVSIVHSVANKLNVRAVVPQSCSATRCPLSKGAKSERRYDEVVGVGVKMTGLCVMFAFLGYAGGMYIFTRRIMM